MQTRRKTCKSDIVDLAIKYGVRHRGQTRRQIADSLVGFRQKYMNKKEKEMVYPFATANKNRKLMS